MHASAIAAHASHLDTPELRYGRCRLHAAKEKADARRRAALYAADHPIDPATGRPFFHPETGRGPAARNKHGMPVGEWLYTKWCAALSAQLTCAHPGLAAAPVHQGSRHF